MVHVSSFLFEDKRAISGSGTISLKRNQKNIQTGLILGVSILSGTDRITLPRKQMQNPLSMLSGLSVAKASSSKYTQLSDLEDSPAPLTYGISPRLSKFCHTLMSW